MSRTNTGDLAYQMMLLQRQGKVEAPKPAEKPKFRPVTPFKQGRTAMPGEARELSNAEWFQNLCVDAGISCTVRQASKYIQKRGVAWTFKKQKERSQ